MKNIKALSKIVNYILLFSPIIVSSLFIYNSKYPAWANTLLFCSILSVIFAFNLYFKYKKEKESNMVIMLVNTLSILFVLGVGIFYERVFIFNLFGKGIEEWSAVASLLLFLGFGYFLSLRGKSNKVAILTSTFVLLYTVSNYFLIKNNIKVFNYTAYLNVPMLSFAKIICLPFVFTSVTLLASLLAFFIERKGIIFTNIGYKKWYKFLTIIILLLTLALLARNILRFVAANSYYKASIAFTNNNLIEAKTNLDNAITIAPFDEYYLARIEVKTAEIEKLLSSSSTSSPELQNKYKVLVESQISDALKAVDYDNKNPKNYMALGLAYERSMLLSKDDGYKKSIDAYEKARNLASDKDYVDVIKAKVSFGASKEEEALKYIDSALKYNSSSSPALFISSQYYASKNNLASAIEYGEKAVLSAPTAVDARLSLGLLYVQDKRYNEAIQIFGTVLQLTNGQNVGAMYYLAVSYKLKGDKSNLALVINELEKRIDPESKEMIDLKADINNTDTTKPSKK